MQLDLVLFAQYRLLMLLIGFGGKNNNEFRLWIGENIEGDSHVQNEDGTYEAGAILEPFIKKLNV